MFGLPLVLEMKKMNGTDIFMTDGDTIRDAFSEPGPSSSLERPIPPADDPPQMKVGTGL